MKLKLWFWHTDLSCSLISVIFLYWNKEIFRLFGHPKPNDIDLTLNFYVLSLSVCLSVCSQIHVLTRLETFIMDRQPFWEEDVPMVNLLRLAYPTSSVVQENDNFMVGASGLGCDNRVSCVKTILIFLFSEIIYFGILFSNTRIFIKPIEFYKTST